MRTFRLAMAQINVTVGDLAGNTRKIIRYVEKARAQEADLVAFPELAIPGYPPEDLVFKPQFVRDNLKYLEEITAASTGIAVVVGFIDGRTHLYNAAAVACDEKLAGVYHKAFLPNYGVFDEMRYFREGSDCPIFEINGTAVGVSICEDIWHPTGPLVTQHAAGAEIAVNINGSPFHAGKNTFREKMLSTRASDHGMFVAYVNLVGGQDELVFDGASLIMGPEGEVVARAGLFRESLVVADLDVDSPSRLRIRERRSERGVPERATDHCRIFVSSRRDKAPDAIPAPVQPRSYDGSAEVYEALVLGTRDYVSKCGFEKVLIALSGGIDSSLVAAIAVDALGAENVTGVAMPSRFSSEGSVLDARQLAENLSISLWETSIEAGFQAILGSLEPHFGDTDFSIAEENLQSRIRGNLIMTMSNKLGWLVLTTGNKSELATGYATLYGDMSGGFAVIKDVPKTIVYDLAKFRNARGPGDVIPQTVLDKPPSAELRPDQRDDDSLPPYDVLDPILKAYVEDDLTFDEILAQGHEPDAVKLAIELVDRSEYKRRQAPPGIKITPRNFGRDRRMPIANRYRPF